ncbi:hypothetical protein P5705_25850 [Pseudomonas entomophila]|uniref:hypothetical protein n=1 Tax=Pseudomonas entomophila TaxID=312306 RepID=UPI002405C2C8|nr:hypothetical protein [Pseudomonas entomophila]MDF9621082.1 hypothetical protein [Pseudomonas entomophila]
MHWGREYASLSTRAKKGRIYFYCSEVEKNKSVNFFLNQMQRAKRQRKLTDQNGEVAWMAHDKTLGEIKSYGDAGGSDFSVWMLVEYAEFE